MNRILLIDDDSDLAQTCAVMLERAGHEVVTVRGVSEGLSVLKSSIMDLALTDLRMPGRPGTEFIAEARQLCPDMPIIAMSGGDTGEDDMVAAFQLGARDVLQKPFRRAQLLDAVRRGLTAE